MLASQRRSVILELVEEAGAVKVSDLVERLGVSDMTIRRDIERLLDRRAARARPRRGTGARRHPDQRRARVLGQVPAPAAQKQAIARAAARRVEPGSAIGISAGTTTYELARAVKDVPQLTVVTNSVPVAQLLHESGTPGQTVVLTGGVRTPPTPSSARSPWRPCVRSTSTCSSSARTASTRAPG